MWWKAGWSDRSAPTLGRCPRSARGAGRFAGFSRRWQTSSAHRCRSGSRARCCATGRTAGLLEAGRRVGLRADRLGPPPAMCTAAGMSSISSCRASADSPHTTARGARAHGRQIRVRGLRCICSPVDPAGEFVCLAFRDQVRQIAGGEQGLTCLRRRERRGEAGQPLLQARVLRSTRVSGGTPQVSSGDRQGSRRCE